MGFFTRGGMKHAAKREARAWSGLPVRGLTALLLVAATTGVVVSAVRDAPAQPTPDATGSSLASRGSELAALVARSGARKSPASIRNRLAQIRVSTRSHSGISAYFCNLNRRLWQLRIQSSARVLPRPRGT